MINLLICFLITSYAWSKSDFYLHSVEVECQTSTACSQRSIRFKTLEGQYRSLTHLKETLKVLASDGGYKSFFYSLEKRNEQDHLFIKFALKPVIGKIVIRFEDGKADYDPAQLIPLREGEYFEEQKLKDSADSIKKKLEAYGYPESSSTVKVSEDDTNVRLNFDVKLGKPRIFKSIAANSRSIFITNYLKRKFTTLYNKPFDINRFKIYLDEAQKELFSYGYYLINLDFTPEFKKRRVKLNITVTNEELFAFDLRNVTREHRDILHKHLVELIKKLKKPLSQQMIKSALRDHYRSKALLGVKYKIEIENFLNQYSEKVILYRIHFDENGKTRLSSVDFLGNNFFSKSKLKRMFRKEVFELASAHFFDEEYYAYFQEFLKNKYIEKGFAQVRVYDPVYHFNKEDQTVKVEYVIQEGQRAFIKKIELNGVPEEIQEGLLGVLINKTGQPFNPIKMVDDIKLLTNALQELGYYYAEVSNQNDSDLVQYNKKGSEVSINYRILPGPQIRLNRILYLGNDKTKRKVLEKKIALKEGDLLTPSKTREIESAISATGLFNSVSVTPLRHQSKNTATDLLVKVTERDYGLLEIAPGYRTDLGLKLTGTVTYQNIGGYNRSIALRSELNRRTSYTTIDPERRNNIRDIIEHNTSVSYNQGDIFDTLIDGAASAAYQTRRFYAFDANILRLNGTLSRDINRKLSTSLRYQYEDIKQYNATEEINNGSFQIGSLTPSLSYDLRNNQINATRGAFFNLSCEFANPLLLSQKEPDLTINYYKLVSRNRFYLPYKNGTLAVSLVGGIQENLATDQIPTAGSQQLAGYIPTIKVFRLTGMDIIRGFTDEEMNRLPDGKDISDVRVDRKAYMANFKVEPRYFLNDALMAGVFYDAGRVFVNRMDLGELRDSVGVTFKVVTPVGTLDFDYGIKLLRKKDPSGRLEDPGRFHVSIGFF